MTPSLFKYYFAQIPLVKMFIIFLVGVVFGINFSSLFTTVISISICLVLFVLVLINRNNKKLFSLRKRARISNLFILLAFLMLGYSTAGLHYKFRMQSHFSNLLNSENQYFQITIIEPISMKERSVKIVAEINKTLLVESVYNTTGKIILYLEKDSISRSLKFGNVLNINGVLQPVDSPKNPKEFNYKRYLSFLTIYDQAYLPSGSFRVVRESPFSLIGLIYSFRNKLETIIEKYIEGEKQIAVANAILIGKKELLDDDLRRAYSSSGAMHVLAVSGLHVGIIYIILNFSLSLLGKQKKLPWLKPFLIILLIWLYALLTGGSASVLRAATMFTFITVGVNMKRNVNIYNTIASSAFVLIVINPFIVTEVGFQLSYLAVMGIIFLQPKIYNLYSNSNWIIDKTWQITTVSIAAQIATFPLGLLYFHQFPNLFFISNLFVIPAAGIIVYLGVLMFVFSWFKVVAYVIGWLLTWILKNLNYAVSWIDSIPFALSQGIDITTFETYLIYVVIFGLSTAIVYRLKYNLFFSLLVLIVLSISFGYKEYVSYNQYSIIVYHVPKTSAVELIQGNQSYAMFDENLWNNEGQLLFRVKHNWWARNINIFHKEIERHNVEKGISAAEINGSKILFVDSNFTNTNLNLKVDFVIVSNNPTLYLESFSKTVRSAKYIFDTSNTNWRVQYWKDDCVNFGLDCHFVNEGAFVVEL